MKSCGRTFQTEGETAGKRSGVLRELKGGTKGNQELVHIGHCWAEMTCVHFIQWEDNVIRFKKLLSLAR